MDSFGDDTQPTNSYKSMSRLQVYKNLLVIGFMNLFQYSATNPTNALVTSTAGKTLGNVSYSLNYLFSCVFTLLSIPVLNSRVKERETLVANNISLIFFTLCNWYISYYTLIPASVFHGFAVAMAAMTSLVYVNKLSVCYAEEYKLEVKGVISFFTGIAIAFSLVGYMVGNATASAVLTILKSDDSSGVNSTISANSSITSAPNTTNSFSNSDNGCHTNDDGIEFDFLTESVLRGAIVAYSILALLSTILLDDLDKYYRIKYVLTLKEKFVDVVRLLWPGIKSTAKVAIQKKMCLSCPLFVTIGVTNGFIFSVYTKVYIAECIGVHFVGYVIMIYGVGSALGSFICGKLLGLVAYNLVVITNLAGHSGVMLFLIIWEREPSHVVLFCVPFLWGFCLGAWLAVSGNFFGTCFGKDTEFPFGIYRIMHLGGIGLGAILAFMPVKVYQIVLVTFLILFAFLHLIVKRVCSYVASD